MTALLRTTRSARIASHPAVPALGAPRGDTGQCGPGGGVGVQRVGLAVRPPVLTVGPVDLQDLDAGRTHVAGQRSAVSAGPLDMYSLESAVTG